jgi:hypothetical protein
LKDEQDITMRDTQQLAYDPLIHTPSTDHHHPSLLIPSSLLTTSSPRDFSPWIATAHRFENYKTFIETATCTTEVFRDVNVIEDTTEQLLNKLPEFSDACKYVCL